MQWERLIGGSSSGGRWLRPTVGKKLSAVFFVLILMTAASLLVTDLLYDTVADTPTLINESGRLRYLSQQIGQKAARVAQDGADRDLLLRLASDYDAKLAEIENKCEELFVATDKPSAALAALRQDWDTHRALVERLLKAASAGEARSAQEEIYNRSDLLLARADAIVGELVATAKRNHDHIDALIILTLAMDVLFMALIFRMIQRTVTLPLAEASRALRRFASGDRAVRLAIDGADEIGDLCRAFNRTAEETGSLILELATKSTILDEASDFVATIDRARKLLYINRAGLAMLAHEAGAAGDLRFEDCFPSWAQAVMRDVGFPDAARGGIWSGESALLTRDGREIPVSQVIVAHKGPGGDVAYFSTIMRDISDRINMENRLTQSRDFYLKLFHDFPNPIWRAGIDARCDYFNKAWLDFTGRSLLEEVDGGRGYGVHADDVERCVAAYREAFETRRPFEIEYRLRRRDGEYRWIVDCGAPFFNMDNVFSGFIGSCHDITERMRYEEQLEFQATHDTLTGLPNRNLLSDRLEQAVRYAGRDRHPAAVLFLDLDQFKFVNDSLGHAVGDRLLAAVAERLRATVRQRDTVARQGGDEFVIVLADVARLEDVAEVAQKLLHCLHAPFLIEDHELFVAASIGVSLYPQDGTDIHTLLRHADMAMYRAKEEGRNNFRFFTADMNARVFERLRLEGHLRRALERGELLLHYQPQIDLASGQMIGMEALLRWRHPELGLVPPGKFIPLAEETGLIVAIGAWVMKTACAQNKAWQDVGLPPLTVAVNLSARQFEREDMVDVVRRTLEETGLDPRHLELELTESMVMRNPEHVIEVLRRLSDMGVHLSIDDFGTGYSSLSYLKRFPIDKVKIDQSFVRDITTDPDDAAIAKTIVSIAHDMRLDVIAEGVETQEQVDALRGYGCDGIQGYLFSRPVPAEDMDALLRERRRLAVPPQAAPERTLMTAEGA